MPADDSDVVAELGFHLHVASLHHILYHLNTAPVMIKCMQTVEKIRQVVYKSKMKNQTPFRLELKKVGAKCHSRSL